MICTIYQTVILIILLIYANILVWVTPDFEMAKCFSEPGLCMKV